MSKFKIVPTKQYRKNYKRLQKSGYDVLKLETVIDMLAAGTPLPDRYRDHMLHGASRGTRACHISPDWLLQYAKLEDSLILLLIQTGTHRDVLNIE